MGSGTSGSSTSQPEPSQTINPIAGVIANLFGINTYINQRGGIQMTSGEGFGSQQFANSAFGPGSGFENLARLLTPEALNPFGSNILGMGDLASSGAGDALGFLNPTLEGLMNVGDPIDMKPIINQSLTDVAEQFGSLGAFNSSDFLDAATRTSAQLRVGEAQAARERELGAAPLIGGLSQMLGNIPMQTGLDLMAMGEQYNLGTSTPWGQSSTLMQMMAGLQPTGAVPRGNVSSSRSKSGGVG